jgi:hypothetical protein
MKSVWAVVYGQNLIWLDFWFVIVTWGRFFCAKNSDYGQNSDEIYGRNKSWILLFYFPHYGRKFCRKTNMQESTFYYGRKFCRNLVRIIVKKEVEKSIFFSPVFLKKLRPE